MFLVLDLLAGCTDDGISLPAAPVITTVALDGATEGEAYSFTLQATGSGITWSLESGTLPDGITLNTGTGALTGTPTESGTFGSLVFRATNAGGYDEATLSLEVTASFDMEAWLETAAVYLDPDDGATLNLSGPDLVSIASKGTKGAYLGKVFSGGAVIGTLGAHAAIDSSAGVVRLDGRNAADLANLTLDDVINAGASTWVYAVSFTNADSNRVLGADAGGYLTITGSGGSSTPRATYYDTGDKVAVAAAGLSAATPAIIVVQHDGAGNLTISVNGVAGTPVACGNLGAVTGAVRFLNAFTGQAGKMATWESAAPTDLAAGVAALKTYYGIS